MPLDTGSVLSADSKLYVKAELDYAVDSLPLTFYLGSSPDHDMTFNMTYIGGRIWHATLKDSKMLGLKSYNTVYAKTIFPGSDTIAWGLVSLEVALPEILFEVDGEFTDTVFIRSDSMKLAGDPGACLRFYSDGEKQGVATDGLVDSAGYKYKSRWTANANRPAVWQKTYYRQFPPGTTYRKWDNISDDCHVTFNRDSLYAIGGLLTMESKGKLKPVYDIHDSLAKIDNSFKVVTDSITPNGDSIKTKRILIDQDPPNSAFLEKLTRDRIRGIAWQEYAGSADISHCHYHIPNDGDIYNPQLNHYWDIFISHGDTCIDSLTPCENRWGVDTGIMQIFRTAATWSWENWFSPGAIHPPGGYIPARWDSMTWDWTINIANGKYIHDIYMPYKFNAAQRAFPESCSYEECELFPRSKNKEDLKSYGYHAGEVDMKKITSDSLWDEIICDTIPPIKEDADYVQKVRRFNYERPWE